MQQTDINNYFKKSLSDIDFSNDVITEVRNKIDWIPKEYLSSLDILTFAICNSTYILNHFEEIKPINEEDANLKLYAYVRHNPYLNLDIICKFDKCREEFQFMYYGLVKIGSYKYNPLQTYIWEYLTKRNMIGNNKQRFDALCNLVYLVDLSEKDSDENDSFFYIDGCKIPDRLHIIAQQAYTHHKVLDIILQISGIAVYNQEHSEMILDNTYDQALIQLPGYLRLSQFEYLEQAYDIQINQQNHSIVMNKKIALEQ